MTRIRISAAVLCALIISSILSSVWVNIRCEELLGSIEEISSYIDAGDKEAASSAAKELSLSWSSFRKKASVMIKSERISEIDRINARLLFLLENDSDELESELTEMKSMLCLLKAGETPTFTSVL